MGYSLAERKEILEIYLTNNKNKYLAEREYARKFPQRRVPSKNTFSNIYRKFRNGESLKDKKREKQRPKTGEGMEMDVLLFFTEHPNKSTNAAAEEFDVSQASIRRILKRYKYKPYSILPVQLLTENNFADRRDFCREMIERAENDNNFLKNLFWTDESSFSTAGLFNRKNAHYWATENPHIIKKIKTQGYNTVNVWCGIHQNTIVGPVFINGSLNAVRYLNILQGEVEDYLDTIPLANRNSVIWQQDGAPPHSVRNVTEYLNERYPFWIGRYGRIHWPANSPDLSPLDFFLWGTLKQNVYENSIYNNADELKECIRQAIENLRQNVHLFENVRNEFIKRCQLCFERNGGYVENI